MTVKSTISFTDRHHRFAKEKVAEGVMPSVSSLVALGLEQLIQDEKERNMALTAMQKTIAQRLQTPLNEWVNHDQDNLFDRLRSKHQLED